MSIGGSFAHAVSDGPLLLALPVAAAAGLVSFLSPCCLPLMPGYLSYVTGLAGSELAGKELAGAQLAGAQLAGGDFAPADARRPAGSRLPSTAARRVAVGSVRRLRIVIGSVLFVAGFSAVFVSEGLLFGGLGALMADHRLVLERVLGAVTILMGLAFLGVVPWLDRDLRVHRMPETGLLGAPLLGLVFGLGWTPCLGPTLAAVQGLAFTQSSAGRGAVLTMAYCLGLGVPFVLTGLLFERALGAFAVIKRHYGVVKAAGGGLLVLVGVLLVTGIWDQVTIQLRLVLGGYTAAV
ncbi:MAG: cytochrome c biogenesis protein CcdA [Mycobacteriales bacterium]